MYRAVLFDFGGVFTVSPFGAVASLANDRGVAPEVLSEIVYGSYHEDSDHPWHRLERGEISLEQAREDILDVGKTRGHEVDLWDVFTRMAEHNSGSVVNQQVIDLLEQVKREDYTTMILTNNIRELADGWQKLLPMDAVDLVVDSCVEGVRKPDREIFNRALVKLEGIEPGQCVFLDDVVWNIEAARRSGIHGIEVTPDPDQTVSSLTEFLGLKSGS
jgi:epoxide hydrolase-like predicted phosphatase